MWPYSVLAHWRRVVTKDAAVRAENTYRIVSRPLQACKNCLLSLGRPGESACVLTGKAIEAMGTCSECWVEPTGTCGASCVAERP